MWEETYKTFTDSKPNGELSLCRRQMELIGDLGMEMVHFLTALP